MYFEDIFPEKWPKIQQLTHTFDWSIPEIFQRLSLSMWIKSAIRNVRKPKWCVMCSTRWELSISCFNLLRFGFVREVWQYKHVWWRFGTTISKLYFCLAFLRNILNDMCTNRDWSQTIQNFNTFPVVPMVCKNSSPIVRYRKTSS